MMMVMLRKMMMMTIMMMIMTKLSLIVKFLGISALVIPCQNVILLIKTPIIFEQEAVGLRPMVIGILLRSAA